MDSNLHSRLNSIIWEQIENSKLSEEETVKEIEQYVSDPRIAKELFLKLDDDFDIIKLLYLNKKRSEKAIFIGYISLFMGVLTLVLSMLDTFHEGKIYFFWIGALAGGVSSIVYGKMAVANFQTKLKNMEMRRKQW